MKTSNTKSNTKTGNAKSSEAGISKNEVAKSEAAKPDTVAPEAVIRVLKIGTCPSLSGKSQLTYHVGCNREQELFFCVVANSGGGMFSQEWVSLAAIEKALGKASSEKELTSFLLYPLFTGKSQNSPGFVFAALQGEGLVTASTTKRRCYELTDWAPFHAAMQAWAASGQGPRLEDTPANAKGKSGKPTAKVAKVAKAVTAAGGGEGAAVPKTSAEVAVDIVPTVPAMAAEKLTTRPTSTTKSKEAMPVKTAKAKSYAKSK